MPLPTKLEFAWRATAPFGIRPGVSVAEGGHVLVVTANAELVAFDAEGRNQWTRSLLGSPRSGVVITSDGTRVVASNGGWIEGFDAAGAPRFRVRPGWSQPDQPVTLLPLDDGSLLCASLRQLIWLESDGSTRAATDTTEAIIELYFDEAPVALGRTGVVFRWDGRRPAESIGDFGEPVRSLPLLRQHALVALTQSGLREKNLRTGRVRSWISRIDDDSRGALAAGSPKEVVWLSDDNSLMRARPGGQLAKVALGPQTTSSPFAIAPLSDGQGRIALLNALSELVLLDQKGQVTRETETRCTRPVALLPLAPRKLLLACETGSLWAFREADPEANPKASE